MQMEFSDDEEEEDIDFDASEVTGGEGDPNRGGAPPRCSI